MKAKSITFPALTAVFIVAGGFAEQTLIRESKLPLSFDDTGLEAVAGWYDLSNTNAQIASADPPFPGFATAEEPWPESVVPTFVQGEASANAGFDKISGLGYPGEEGIYGTPVPLLGNGAYSIIDTAPINNVETVAFQIQIGEGSTKTAPPFFGSFFRALPTLTVNGETVVPASGGAIVDFTQEEIAGTADNIVAFGFQYDLRAISSRITSLEIEFGTVGSSSEIYGLQVAQSSRYVQVFPDIDPSVVDE